MALYEPLRDAFDDLNKMIVDSQQWDAQHAAREADNEYRHAVLKSNLQQRRFENDMAEQVMEIRVNGDQRAADAAERAILESNRNYEAQQDRFAFDKSKFVETQERNKLLNEHTALQIDELKKPSTPTRVDLNGLISPRLAKNARFMGELNEWAGARNMIVGDDLIGMSADADGNYIETLVSPNEQVKYAPFVRGLAAKYDNPIDNIKEDMVVLEEYRQELLKETTGKDNYNLKERAEARRKVNVIEAELASQKKELLNPETAKESYGRRAREMQGASDWLRLQGANDAADDYSAGAMKLLDRAIASDKASRGQRVQSWKIGLENNASVPGPDWTYNTVTEMYTRQVKQEDGSYIQESVGDLAEVGLTSDEPTPVRAESTTAANQTATRMDKAFEFGHNQLRKDLSPSSDILDTFPDQKAGIEYAEGLFTSLADKTIINKDGKEESAAPRNKREAALLKKKALALFRDNHNTAYNQYVSVKNNPKRLAQWEEMALNEFGYLPVKPFTKQIWRGKVKAKK
jgi:hypothetical protein